MYNIQTVMLLYFVCQHRNMLGRDGGAGIKPQKAVQPQKFPRAMQTAAELVMRHTLSW